MKNALNRDQQTYLLAYWVRSNCNEIMAALDTPYKTGADIKKIYDNVAKMIGDALEAEFEIEDEAVVIEVTNLIYPIDPALHETKPEDGTGNFITLEDLTDLREAIMTANKQAVEMTAQIRLLNKQLDLMCNNIYGMRRIYTDLQEKVK